nr:UdgX family uracil-DNA binding protein [Hyphomicrobium sp. 99]
MPKNTTDASAPSITPNDLFQTDEPKSLSGLNEIIAAAKPMVHGGKKAVLGEGPIGADLAFVGEQPGYQEDLQGRPFVGPAGQLLNKALTEAGIDREDTYVTNAVKHFKYEERGKRRIHQKPTMGEIKHYRWWLLKELGFVHPRLVVALGATAAAALAGAPVAIGKSRGKYQFGNFPGFVTIHPSSLLRMPDHDEREHAFADFVRDLKTAQKLVH